MAHRITSIGLLAALVVLALLVSPAIAADDDMRQMKNGAITVWYPPKLEEQAKRVMEVAGKSIEPGLAAHNQIVSLLADPSSIAADMAGMMGAEEVQVKTAERLTAYREKSRALIASFSTVRLIDAAGVIAAGGADCGVLQIRYFRDNDEFKMGVDLSRVNKETLDRSYYPVLVNADGRVRGEDKLPNMITDLLGSSRLMALAPIHETAMWILAEQLNLYHPFGRWFNEGVSGWVTRRMITKLDPTLGSLAGQVYLPGAAAKKVRDKVNFPAWPQLAFQNRNDRGHDPAVEVAQTQYAVEAIGNLLGGNRAGQLAKIVGELKYNPNADSDAICAAILKTTGTDFQKTLQSYIPDDIRKAGPGEAKKQIAQAEKLVQEKKWEEAAVKLKRALQITPQDTNARLNLAWILRETGNRVDSELQVFLAARLLKPDNHSFSLFAPSVEGNYIIGRLAIMMGDLEYARKFIQPVLEAKPDHEDAKRAMQEIKAIESAAKTGS